MAQEMSRDEVCCGMDAAQVVTEGKVCWGGASGNGALGHWCHCCRVSHCFD